MSSDLVHWVDPFIGVDQPGNCLVGPYLPYGMVQLGPDSLLPLVFNGQATNGYNSALSILRFSHTHISGAGGGARHGNIGVVPMIGEPRFYHGPYDKADEKAEAGYYAVRLQPQNILAELTVSRRVGVHRYTFPAGERGSLLIDAGAVIQALGHGQIRSLGQDVGVSVGGFIEILSDTELMGRCDAAGGWSGGYPYTFFFYAKVDQPFSFSTVAEARGPLDGRLPTVKKYTSGPNCRALVAFAAGGSVTLKVGLSHVSFAKAKQNLDEEVGDKTFNDVRGAAREVWSQTLAKAVPATDARDLPVRLFHTFHTRLLCLPNDLGSSADEFVYWNTPVRHFNNFYVYWDSVRNANSLGFLLDTRNEIDKLNCILDIADRKGWLVDGWIGGKSSFIQGGSSTDILFAEAAQKKLPGIDYAKALRYMRKNREERSPDPELYGRYPAYHDLGFLPLNIRECCSRNLEYGYQDWCIGTLASILGQEDVAHAALKASRTIWEHWRDDVKAFAPKSADGKWWHDYDPYRRHGLAPGQEHFFYEESGHYWSLNTHHDFAGLVVRHGGAEGFVMHLDHIFEKLNWHTKETILHVPYLYHYAGRPDLTADRVRWTLREFYEKKLKGLAGNEDMGCVSAYYMWSCMGLYPIMGQDLYLLSTPQFRRLDLRVGIDERQLSIITDADPEEKPYIASVSLNGHAHADCWLRHADLAQGGALIIKLSKHPTDWGRQPPPSPCCIRS